MVGVVVGVVVVVAVAVVVGVAVVVAVAVVVGVAVGVAVAVAVAVGVAVGIAGRSMKPIKTLNSNHNFGPPPGCEHDIGDLPCQIVEERGFREIVSVWKLSPEDRAAIANGYNLRLGVGWIGAFFPPVSLGVTHEMPLLDFTPEDVIG